MIQTPPVRPCPFIYKGSIHSQTRLYSLYTLYRPYSLRPSVGERKHKSSSGKSRMGIRQHVSNTSLTIENLVDMIHL